MSHEQLTPVVRIIALPRVRMARSGGGDLDAFFHWWSAVAAQDRFSLFPCNFLWDNPRVEGFEWLYALPAGVEDTGGYETFEFPGGLWAVATCLDEGPDIARTTEIIHAWIAASDVVCEAPTDEDPPRYEMGQIVSPPDGKEMLGFWQMDLFVPVVYRGHRA
ncbi:MAG: GyrI-like domain-containing protein [Anaerolineae bacterium]